MSPLRNSGTTRLVCVARCRVGGSRVARVRLSAWHQGPFGSRGPHPTIRGPETALHTPCVTPTQPPSPFPIPIPIPNSSNQPLQPAPLQRPSPFPRKHHTPSPPPSPQPTMKVSNASLLALLLPAVSARFVEAGEPDAAVLYPDGLPKVPKDTQKYHIELSPGKTKWITEDEKWELRRVRPPPASPLLSHFLIANNTDLRTASASSTSPTTQNSARFARRPPTRGASFPRNPRTRMR